ncbi:hypothetical protein Q5692_37820 [Microcoleus sp. C2C3]|uniref:hypothetical protein n=1 Tax=unclassified Microcoleus TaxID=2642155 RepID=UPI002FD48633
MRIDRIGFGYVKSLGNYENCKLWLEAELEPWEDPLESLNILRSKVAEELDLPDKWFDLKGKFNRQMQALEATNATLLQSETKLKKAQEAWKNYAAFLTAHGVDPETLLIIPNSKSEEIARELIDRELDIAAKQLLPDLRSTEEGYSVQLVDLTSYNNTSEGENLAQELEIVKKLHPLNNDDDYFDPYYGDEYDRIHDQVDEEDNY